MRFSFGLLSAVALLCATASDAYPVHALIDNSIGFADTAKRDADLPLCKAYTIIQSRGTNETQGPSAGFVLMNGFTLANAPGGNQYFTVYPASWDQDSNNATSDIVSKIADLVKFDPAHCVILQGYSQGAAATTHALPLLSGASADAVKGVFMIGNPLHRPGLASNVDPKGGNSTTSAVGLEAKVFTQATSIPDAFINRTLDVCLSGDGVCDSSNGFGYGNNNQHLSYGLDMDTQTMGYIFMTSMLHHGSYQHVVSTV